MFLFHLVQIRMLKIVGYKLSSNESQTSASDIVIRSTIVTLLAHILANDALNMMVQILVNYISQMRG